MRADVTKQPRILTAGTFVTIAALIVIRLFRAPYAAEGAVVRGIVEGAVGSGIAEGIVRRGVAEGSVAADMPLGRLIDGAFGHLPAAALAVNLFLLLVCGILLTRIVIGYKVSTSRTFLPAMMYIFIGYGLMAPLGSVGAVLSSVLLIISSQQAIASFKRAYTFNNVFNSAFCLGIMPLIYSASLPLVLILPIALSLYRRTVREWIVALAGLLLPLLLASASWNAAGCGWVFVIDSLRGAFTVHSGVWAAFGEVGIDGYAYAGLSAIMLLLSMGAMISGLHKASVRVRKIYIHFICLMVFSMATLAMPSANISSLALIAVPAAIVLTVFFVRVRGWIALTAYVVLTALVIILNSMPLF